VRIHEDGGVARGIAQQSQPVPASRGEVAGRTAGPGPGGDRIELSDRGRALHAARRALTELPDVRPWKVQALQQRIRSGTYTVSGERVAERMLGEGLFG